MQLFCFIHRIWNVFSLDSISNPIFLIAENFDFFSYCTTRTQFFDSRLDSTLLSCMFFFSSLHFILFTVHRSIVLVPLYTELWLYWAHFTLIPFDFTHRTRFSVRNTQSLSNSLSSVSMIMTVEIERMKCQSLSHLQYARILGFWKLFPPRFFLDLRSNVIIKINFLQIHSEQTIYYCGIY